MGWNSILCTECKIWCHKRCSGQKKVGGIQNFKCPECKKDKMTEEKRDATTLGRQIEEGQEFYLGDMLDCEAGVERAVRARVGAAWKKWRYLAGMLTDRTPLKIRGSAYESCVRSVSCCMDLRHGQ